MNQPNPFKWRHFEAEIILLCVRWYLRYALSYRDLEELMQERGLQVDHTTIYRWVQHYAPELEKRCRPHLKATNASWRVDESYVIPSCNRREEYERMRNSCGCTASRRFYGKDHPSGSSSLGRGSQNETATGLTSDVSARLVDHL